VEDSSIKGVNQPLLSIAVPAFNVEDYLEDCLQSLVSLDSNKVEVVIIDDGSVDNTSKIARRFSSKHSHFSLITKLNGGHGSTINTALREARGLYFKVLDGDDLIDDKSMESLLEYLEDSDADIVLTDYTEFYMSSGTYKPIINYTQLGPGTVYSLDSADSKNSPPFDDKGPLLSTTTFKTSIFKENPFSLDEKCYYVDMEYNFFIYQRAKTVTYLPLQLYVYRLDREGQSMQRSSLIKNYRDHEKVSLRLVTELSNLHNISEQKYRYLFEKIVAPLCRSHYQILVEYLAGRKQFLEFDRKLKRFSDIYYSPLVSGKIISVHRFSHGITLACDALFRKIGKALSN
jgi:glycosyltransferase involved in cell wall biosynthesis